MLTHLAIQVSYKTYNASVWRMDFKSYCKVLTVTQINHLCCVFLEYVRECQRMFLEYVRECQSMLEYVRVCSQSILECVLRVCQRTFLEYVLRVCQSMLEYVCCALCLWGAAQSLHGICFRMMKCAASSDFSLRLRLQQRDGNECLIPLPPRTIH